MALVKCPECGKENVSDQAVACPECGYKINKANLGAKSKSRKPKIVIILAILIALILGVCLIFVLKPKEVVRGVKWNDSISTVESIEKENSPMAEITKKSDALIVDAGHKRRLIFWEGVDCTRVWYGFDDQFGLNEVVMYFQESDSISFEAINSILIDKYGEPDSTEDSIFGKESTWIDGNTRIKLENAGKEGETFTIGVLREAEFRLTYSKENE